MKNWIWAICSGIVVSSCAADNSEVNATFEEPYRFYLYSNLDGQTLNHQAGNNSYALFSSYTVNAGLLTMTTLLADDSLSPTNAFAIKLRGLKMAATGVEIHPGKSLDEGNLALASNTGFTRIPNTYNYSFKIDSAYGHRVLTWQTSSGQYTGDSCAFGPVSSDTLPNFALQVTTNGTNTCIPFISHVFETGATASAQMHLSAAGDVLSAQIEAKGSPVSQVSWFIDNAPASLEQFLTIYCTSQSFPLDLKAEIVFANGEKETITKRLNSATISCDIIVLAKHREHAIANSFNENTAEIIYYDASGKMFTSALANNGAFSIVRAYAYENGGGANVNHQQLIFNGHALLRSADGETKILNSLNGSFAFAYPN